MEYTISKLAKLAGVSTRTLRYYDEINLLRPARINHSGYRIYGQEEIDRLQQIRFFRELDVDLVTIVSIMNDPQFDKTNALQQHYAQLVNKRSHIDKLIHTLEKTIAHERGEYLMTNEEKFNAFKEKMIQENEDQYGVEIRQKYGEQTIEASNAKLRGMTEKEYADMKTLEKEIFQLIKQALVLNDPHSDVAQEAAAKHKEWLMYSWSSYSKEAHAGLAEIYVADERFQAYYEKIGKGATELLHNAILIFLEKNK